MAYGDTPITFTGNLTADPDLKFIPSGQAVVTFRVASTPRFQDRSTGEWKDGDTLFMTCKAWRQLAENIAEGLQRGMRVIVNGRLKQRSYETEQGEKRTVYELEVDDAGPSLKNATKVVKTDRRTANGDGFGGLSGSYSPEPVPAGVGPSGSDGWNSSDEPVF